MKFLPFKALFAFLFLISGSVMVASNPAPTGGPEITWGQAFNDVGRMFITTIPFAQILSQLPRPATVLRTTQNDSKSEKERAESPVSAHSTAQSDDWPDMTSDLKKIEEMERNAKHGHQNNSTHGQKPSASTAAASTSSKKPTSSAASSSYAKATEDKSAADSKVKTEQCAICFDDKPTNTFISLSCGHKNFCADCLMDQLKTATKDKNLTSARCPDLKCKAVFTPQNIETIIEFANNAALQKQNQSEVHAILQLSDDLKKIQERDKELKKRGEELNKPGARECPTPNCKAIFFNKDNKREQHACPDCKKSYCANCRIKHDAKKTCEKAKKEQETANDKWKKENTKDCPNPKCKAAIEKNEGCNHMTCQKCRNEFCWVCLGNWPRCKCVIEREQMHANIDHIVPAAEIMDAIFSNNRRYIIRFNRPLTHPMYDHFFNFLQRNQRFNQNHVRAETVSQPEGNLLTNIRITVETRLQDPDFRNVLAQANRNLAQNYPRLRDQQARQPIPNVDDFIDNMLAGFANIAHVWQEPEPAPNNAAQRRATRANANVVNAQAERAQAHQAAREAREARLNEQRRREHERRQAQEAEQRRQQELERQRAAEQQRREREERRRAAEQRRIREERQLAENKRIAEQLRHQEEQREREENQRRLEAQRKLEEENRRRAEAEKKVSEERVRAVRESSFAKATENRAKLEEERRQENLQVDRAAKIEAKKNAKIAAKRAKLEEEKRRKQLEIERHMEEKTAEEQQIISQKNNAANMAQNWLATQRRQNATSPNAHTISATAARPLTLMDRSGTATQSSTVNRNKIPQPSAFARATADTSAASQKALLLAQQRAQNTQSSTVNKAAKIKHDVEFLNQLLASAAFNFKNYATQEVVPLLAQIDENGHLTFDPETLHAVKEDSMKNFNVIKEYIRIFDSYISQYKQKKAESIKQRYDDLLINVNKLIGKLNK